MTYHWTDDAKEPIFEMRINATGSAGNIFAILGTACGHLRKIDVPSDRIAKLRQDVLNSGSYDQAVAFVEHWFPVDR